MAQAAVYLATAPKSNAVYTAFKAATRVAQEHGSLMPPKTILNAPTKLMKQIGYGDSYRYDHDEPDAFSGQDYWPEKLGANPSTNLSIGALSETSRSGSNGGRGCGQSHHNAIIFYSDNCA